MTPDKARDLLDGTTPGPWEWRWDTGLISLFGANGESVATDLEVQDSDLAAAAPALASMIAGMREEWGVSCGGEKPGAWWASHKEADQCAKRMRICIHYPLPIVVVRRYVTEPEEIS